MQVMPWTTRLARVAARLGGFRCRRKWLVARLIIMALLVGPLLLSGGVAVFGLNGLGLGFGGLLLRRFLFWCMRRTLRR